jgi:hypothetical protein
VVSSTGHIRVALLGLVTLSTEELATKIGFVRWLVELDELSTAAAGSFYPDLGHQCGAGDAAAA